MPTALRESFFPSLGHRSVNKIFHDTTTVRALVVEHVPRNFLHSDLQTFQTLADGSIRFEGKR